MSSTNSPLEGLPLDIRDRLLTLLPNFASLRFTVLSCQALHEAFRLRKYSILKAVVENEVGPAFAEARAVSLEADTARDSAQRQASCTEDDGLPPKVMQGLLQRLASRLEACAEAIVSLCSETRDAHATDDDTTSTARVATVDARGDNLRRKIDSVILKMVTEAAQDTRHLATCVR